MIGGTIEIHISKDDYTLGHDMKYLLVKFVLDYECGENSDFLWGERSGLGHVPRRLIYTYIYVNHMIRAINQLPR